MIESMLVVLSRALPGRDDEMNDWYTNIHLRDALRYRGSIAVQRFTAATHQGGPLTPDWPWRYLALYEVYDAALFTQSHRDAADTVWMEISEAFDASLINDFYYYPMIWRSNAIDQLHSGGAIMEQFNAAPDQDEALRQWYAEVYFPAAMRRPGVHAGAFLPYRSHGQMMPYDPDYHYVALYWTQDDDEASTAWEDPTLRESPLVDPAGPCVSRWHRLTRRLTEDDVLHSSAADLAAEEQARARLTRATGGASGRANLGLE
jgi:hypothetical protein